MRHRASLFVLLVLFSPAAVADTSSDDEAIRAAVSALMPGGGPIAVSPSPIKGIREVVLGTQVLYASADGQFVLGGPLVKTASGENLTSRSQASARARLLSDQKRTRPFSWPAQNTRHTLTVVTDIDCPYCRKLHKEIPALNAAGVSVDYIMLPRAGRDSPSYDKTIGAACTADAPGAITSAMLGASFERATCDHPIDQHMQLARDLGVSSTPMIVLPNGEFAAGHKSASALLELLEN